MRNGFLTQTGLNIMINLGLFPACATSLPFLSAGGGNILLSYTLMGIVLSIYRYKIYIRAFRTPGSFFPLALIPSAL